MTNLHWLNEPPHWNITNDVLHITTGKNTDFWRVTHYDFIRDDGHVYYQTISGDFVASLRFSGKYQHLYDQAGLMLRNDKKTG